MSERPVPTADELKRCALGRDVDELVTLATSNIVVIQVLANAGQAAAALRDQVAILSGSKDPIDIEILEAHAAAESLVEHCAQAAHLIIKTILEREARRQAAKYN